MFSPPKTPKARRLVSLTPSNILVLRQHQERQEADQALLGQPLTDDSLIFCQADGRPLLPDTVTHAWIKLVRKTGFRGIRLHDARHTHATLLLRADVHPKVVQERLGHSSISVTLDTYTHVVPGMQEAAARRFDNVLIPEGHPVPATPSGTHA